jgi:hypothetical protein
MNKKIIIIISVIIGVMVLTIIALLIFAKPTPQSATISLPIKNNQTITTKDFITLAPVKDERSVILYFDSNYSIMYETKANYFQINFSLANIQELKKARLEAENMLLSKLGISQEDICKLDVIEIIQQSEALSLNNYNYPLSFCGQQPEFAK